MWLQDSILVAGYPLGGDSLSITKGIVSRVRSLGCTCSTPAIDLLQTVVQCYTTYSPRVGTSIRLASGCQLRACLHNVVGVNEIHVVMHSMVAGCDDTLCACIQQVAWNPD